uniref:Uncharacterized protein n=1 Tax=Rangifer tarandus platyrhynchus TaxID=3082113 RepID=A0ACB0FIL0_RANTA|nr:unnamed protein product [Rangifer tarandus platyrhynchus]
MHWWGSHGSLCKACEAGWKAQGEGWAPMGGTPRKVGRGLQGQEAAAQASLGGAVRVPTASLRRSASSIACRGLELTWGTLRVSPTGV